MKSLKKKLGKWYGLFEIVFIFIPIAFIIRTFGFGLYQVPTGSMETTLLVGERFFADKLSYWFRKPQRGEIIAFNEPLYPYSSNPIIRLWQNYISWNVSNYTKRVIGIPGDHIQGKIEDGRPVIYRNGEKLDESGYVNKYPLIATWGSPQSIYEGFCEEKIDNRTYDPSLPFDQQKFYKVDPTKIIRNEAGEPILTFPNMPLPKNKDVFDIKLADNKYWVMGDNRMGSADCRMWGRTSGLDGSSIHGRIVFRIFSMDTNETWLLIDLLKNPIGFWKKIRWDRCFQFVS